MHYYEIKYRHLMLLFFLQKSLSVSKGLNRRDGTCMILLLLLFHFSLNSHVFNWESYESTGELSLRQLRSLGFGSSNPHPSEHLLLFFFFSPNATLKWEFIVERLPAKNISMGHFVSSLAVSFPGVLLKFLSLTFSTVL